MSTIGILHWFWDKSALQMLYVCPLGTKKQKEYVITFKFMTAIAFSHRNLPQPPCCGRHFVGFLQHSFSWGSCYLVYFILSMGVAHFEQLSVLFHSLSGIIPLLTYPLELGTSQVTAHLQPCLSPDSFLARKRNKLKVFQQKEDDGETEMEYLEKRD